MIKRLLWIVAALVMLHAVASAADALNVGLVFGLVAGWALAAWVIWRAWPRCVEDVRRVAAAVPRPSLRRRSKVRGGGF